MRFGPAARRVAVEKVAYCCDKHTCAYPTHAELNQKGTESEESESRRLFLIRITILQVRRENWPVRYQ